MYEEIRHSSFKKYIVPMIDDWEIKKSRFLLNNQIFLIQYPQELNNSALSPQEYSNLINDINKNLRKSRKFIKIFTILSTLHFILSIVAFLIVSILFKDYIFESAPIVAGTFSSLLVFPSIIFVCYILFYLKRNRIVYEYNKFFKSKRIHIQFKEFRGFNGSPKLKIYYPPIIQNLNGSVLNSSVSVDHNLNFLLDGETPSGSNISTLSPSPSSSMVSSAASSTSSLNSLIVNSNQQQQPASSSLIDSSSALEPSLMYKDFININLDDNNQNQNHQHHHNNNSSNNNLNYNSFDNYKNIIKDFSSISIIPTPPNSNNNNNSSKNNLDSFSEKTPLLGHR